MKRLFLIASFTTFFAGCGSCGGSSTPVEEHRTDASMHSVMSQGDGGRVYNVRNQPNPLLLKLVDGGHGTTAP